VKGSTVFDGEKGNLEKRYYASDYERTREYLRERERERHRQNNEWKIEIMGK